MEIKQLHYFKTIVEAGTISKASQVLHMAQPPLSIQLKQLEEELGCQLLKRGHRTIELTAQGKLLYKRSLQILDLHELTTHEIKDIQSEVLRIGVTSSNHAFLQQEKVIDYLKSHQQLSCRLHEGTTYEMKELLLAHNIDIGIVRTPFDESQVDLYALQSEPMIAIGQTHYFSQPISSIEQLQKVPLIVHQRYVPLVLDYCLNLHFNPFLKMTADDCRTSLLWATLGLGVAIIPQSGLPAFLDQSLTYYPLQDQELYTTVTLITRQGEQEQRIQDFISTLCK